MTNTLTVLQTSATGNPLKLHHSILKAAARRGFYFVGTDEDEFQLVRTDDPSLLSTEAYSTTSEALEAFDAGEVEFEAPEQDEKEGDDEDDGERSRCGVMATEYHARYSNNPHGPGSGDALDIAMREVFTVVVDGKDQLDADALRATGEANDVWNPLWENLNKGMRRMNLANRLRGRLRNHDGKVQLCDATGKVLRTSRFGIEQKGKA